MNIRRRRKGKAPLICFFLIMILFIQPFITYPVKGMDLDEAYETIRLDLDESIVNNDYLYYPQVPNNLTQPLNGWYQQDGELYYFQNSTMARGWRSIKGVYYFFYEDGRACRDWLETDAVAYGFGVDGRYIQGKAVAAYALSREGAPYSMEKRGSGDYLDCSLLTQLSYRKAGIEIPSTAAAQGQYASANGYTIELTELQQGDLVFWKRSGCSCGRWNEIHHVGIYLGGGKIIDASTTVGKVVVRDLWESSSFQIAMCARIPAARPF